MRSVFITGCNRGLGLGLVKQLLKSDDPPKHIITTCRNRDKAEALHKLSIEHQNVRILELDVNNLESFDNLRKSVEDIVQDNGINVLINNAGISTKFTRVGLVKAEHMFDNFKTNAVAPLMLTKAFLPLLKKASEQYSHLPVGVRRAAVVNISSVLGSIGKNDTGGFYPYRCSKSALNAITKSLSIDVKDYNILVVSIHPGWCKTDLGGPNAPLEVDYTMKELLRTLNTLTIEHNGAFIQYDGAPLPW